MNEGKKFRFLGSLFGKSTNFAGAVFDRQFICPALNTMQGGADSR